MGALAWQFNSFCAPGEDQGRQLFFAPAFCNHSCAPNCYWDRDAEGHFLLMSGSSGLQEGEALSISYLCFESLTLPCHDRRELLAQSWLFFCLCVRCAAELALSACVACGASMVAYVSDRDEEPYECEAVMCDECRADDLAYLHAYYFHCPGCERDLCPWCLQPALCESS